MFEQISQQLFVFRHNNIITDGIVTGLCSQTVEVDVMVRWYKFVCKRV